MIRTDKRLRLCAALLICKLIFIWGNSLLPGEVSGALSDWAKGVLEMLFAQEPSRPSSGGLLRKIAHFTEFTALGMLLLWLFSMLGKHWVFALASGVTAACMDEAIQVFVPNRGPALRDVGIDALGVLTGIALLSLGHTYLNKKSNT